MPTFEALIEVVTFDLFGYWIEDRDFGQTETEPYTSNFDRLKYDSLNIITNMFSIHIFVTLLLIRSLFTILFGLRCLQNFRMCNKMAKASALFTLIQGG